MNTPSWVMNSAPSVSGMITSVSRPCSSSPMSGSPETFAMEALAHLHNHEVDQMPVVDAVSTLVGLLDVQDLLDLKIG